MIILTSVLALFITVQIPPEDSPLKYNGGWVLTHVVKYPMGEMRAMLRQYHTWAECYEAIPRWTASGDIVEGINEDANKMAVRDQTREYPAHFSCFDNPLGEESEL